MGVNPYPTPSRQRGLQTTMMAWERDRRGNLCQSIILLIRNTIDLTNFQAWLMLYQDALT